MAEICSTTFGNPGVKCDKGDIRGVPVGLIFTTKTFSFGSFTDFADEAEWKTAIKEKNIFPISGILEFDDNTEETTYYTSPLGIKKFIRDGKYDLTFRFDAGLQQNKEMQKFSGAKIRAFILDSNGYVWGYSDDNTTVQGFSIANLKFENQKVTTADAPGWTPCSITFANPREWNDYGVLLQPDFVVADLSSLSVVNISVVGTPSSTSLNIYVGAKTGVYDGTGAEVLIPIAGIASADFTVVKASDGTSQSVTFTSVGDGNYTGVGTGLVTGTVNLKAATAQSNDFLIESSGAASFTIS